MEKIEYEMFHFFEMTPDLVCIATKDGFFKKINRAVINTLNYSETELFAKPISSFIHPEDIEVTGREREQLLNGKALVNFENRYVTKQQDIIWLHWTSIYLPDRELVFAIAKDVTERKEREKEIEEKYIKFKSLASHFKSSIEKDRKTFAAELHEELAQLASVVKMDIDWISQNLPDSQAALKIRMDHAAAISDLHINTIRKISFSISPNMLDDVGLIETIKWLCNEFSLLHNITCKFVSTYNEANLSHEIKLDFFRICQEALSNVIHHAQAKKVSINIEEIGNKVGLCITDDGKGFDPKIQKRKSGITNMRKRITSINGQLSIKSAPGKGTKVCVKIPKTSNL
jgi:PAS domain S-box-containing protein